MFAEDVSPQKRAKQIAAIKSRFDSLGIKHVGLSSSKLMVKAFNGGHTDADGNLLPAKKTVTESRQMTLLEKLYGPGETRPFEGLRNDQAALRNSETADARAHMARAGVKGTVFQSDADVRKNYYGKSKAAWDDDVAKNTVRTPRYYTMHQDFGNEMIKHLNAKGVKFSMKTSVKSANVPGDQSQHPRTSFVVHGTHNDNEELMGKFGRHLVYEGRTFDAFFSEALDSVTVAGVDGIPRTSPVLNQDDYLDNDKEAIYNGKLPDPSDVVNKIFDGETQARLQARYGDKWIELVSRELATIPRMQPNSHEQVSESWKGLALAAATVATGIGGGVALGHHIGNSVGEYTPEPFVPTHRIVHNGEGVQVIAQHGDHSTVRRWDGRSRRTTAIPNDELVPVNEEVLAEDRNAVRTRSYVAGNIMAMPLRRALKRAQDNGHDLDYHEEKHGWLRTVFHVTAPRHLHDDLHDIIDRINEEAGSELADRMLAEDYVPLTEELAAALNFVNSVGHGDQKPKWKSAHAWLDGVGHLYGDDVASRANDIIDSHGHSAALGFVKDHASQGREALISRSTTSEHGNASRLDNGPYSQLHAVHVNEDFRPGWKNPFGIAGRSPDEVYTKYYGNHDPSPNYAHPGQAPDVPGSILKYPSDKATVTKHLNGMMERGEIRGFTWSPHTDEYGSKAEKLHITATDKQHKNGFIGTKIQNAKRAEYDAAYARRGEWYSERESKEEAPATAADRPLSVTNRDKAVHSYLQDRNGASNEEIAKDVFSDIGDDTDKVKLAQRYRARVAFHQGAGKLK